MHRIAAAALLALALAACARRPWDPPAFDPAQIAADVAWLAADAREGRGLGSAGLAEAADWVARGFADAGLSPGAPDGGWLQRFETTVAVRVAGASLTLNGRPLARGRDFDAFAASASASAAGTLVFAGHGISDERSGWDDYAGVEVRGKVVLILDDRPAQVTADAAPSRALRLARARDLGAAAVLLAPAAAGAPGIAGGAGAETPSPAENSAGILALGLTRAAAERLVAAGGARLSELQAASARRGAPAPRALPRARLRVSAAVERERGEAANVLGVLPGSDPVLRHQAVVIGAHLDHLGRGGAGSLAPGALGQIHNGGDDNASGVAGLLALARAFAAGPAPRRSLVLAAFTGEEAGLLGSSRWVEQPSVALADVAAMLNLDMVGRLRASQLTVFGVDTSPAWPGLVTHAGRGLGLELALVRDGVGPSDHTSFALRSVPVLLFFTGSHPEYHTPADDADTVDAAGEARVLGLVYRVARELLDAPERPAFGVAAGMRPSPGGGESGRAWLGTIPAFGAPAPTGVRLQGVRPGSPAEQAGLREGDVIVGFDGASVATLEELSALLRRAQPGQQVTLEFLRDGERLRGEATLGARR